MIENYNDYEKGLKEDALATNMKAKIKSVPIMLGGQKFNIACCGKEEINKLNKFNLMFKKDFVELFEIWDTKGQNEHRSLV